MVVPVQYVPPPVTVNEVASELTDTRVAIVQPVGNVYVIVVDPPDTPVTTPVVEPIVAIAVLLLLHVPPADVFVSVVVLPTQTLVTPPIAAGNGSIVTKVVV